MHTQDFISDLLLTILKAFSCLLLHVPVDSYYTANSKHTQRPFHLSPVHYISTDNWGEGPLRGGVGLKGYNWKKRVSINHISSVSGEAGHRRVSFWHWDLNPPVMSVFQVHLNDHTNKDLQSFFKHGQKLNQSEWR